MRFASLIGLALALSGCGNPLATSDQGVSDLGTPVDLATTPVDLSLPVDLTAFTPIDLANTPIDMAQRPVDLSQPPVYDLSNPPADLAAVDMSRPPSMLLSFAPPVAYGAGSEPIGVVTADFTGDGKLDLVAANRMSTSVSLLAGTGTGSFGVPVAIPVGAVSSAVATGDFNGDGKPDLVVGLGDRFASSGPGQIKVLINNGNGNPPTVLTYDTPGGQTNTGCGRIVLGDFNFDKQPDIAVACQTTTGVGTDTLLFSLVGTANGTFKTPTFLGRTGLYGLTTGDFDGDHFDDLVFSLVLYKSNGDGTFAAATTTGASALDSAVVGDFDGDLALDFAYCDRSRTRLSRGKGNDTFYPPSTLAIGEALDLVARDLNGDGKLDIIAAGWSSGTVTVALGKGDGTFPLVQSFVAGLAPQSLAVADYNGDGKLDIATADQDVIEVLINTTP